MGVYHLRGDHMSLIARQHAKYSIRGGAGLVFIFLTLLAGLVMAAVVLGPLEMGQKAGVSISEAVEMGTRLISTLTSVDPATLRYLAHEKPAIVSAILILLLYALPFIVALGAFNQTSGDIGSRGLRYLLPRTERANIFVGRFVGTYLFTLLVLAVLIAILALYMVLKLDVYSAGAVILWFAQGYLLLSVFALPYVALCAIVSQAIDSPFGSLVIAFLLIGVYPLLVFIASGIRPQVAYGQYATPWGYKFWLFDASLGMKLAGAGVMVAFAALFVFAGLRSFQKRDL